ncbi:MAG: hypothetical protein LBU89_13565 [Fibromonadaceae bacterium]|jgi:hypothetical protein|nr:hypothetical protein [Fibromonadaceae bacterium]
MRKILCTVLLFSILNSQFSIIYAQEEEPISEMQAMMQETVQAAQPDSPSEDLADNLTPQQRFENDPKHNVRSYNYKQQVVVGGVVMLCVTLAMVANNNYNPKRGR